MHFHHICSAAFLVLTSATLLAQDKPPQVLQWDKTDLGPFHTGTFKVKDQSTVKGIAIKVGTKESPATVLFDPELLRYSAGWVGGFLQFPRARGGLEGQITPVGEIQFSTDYAPGWGQGEIGADPRERHQGQLPANVAKYRGLFLNGDQVVLRYTVGEGTVLEVPRMESKTGVSVFTRTVQAAGIAAGTSMLICDVPGGNGSVDGATARLTVQNPAEIGNDRVTLVGVIGAPAGAKLISGANGRLSLALPAIKTTATFQIVLWTGSSKLQPKVSDLLHASPLPDLAALTKGGAARWGAALETSAKLGTGDEAYVADEILLPDDNPFGSWLRPGGHDFFPDGTMALVNVSGDVWIISGLDEKLEKVKWKRFATGLFQPLGCKVVDGKIYVLGRDQITLLHDLNSDGEADYYENFNNDCVVTDNYHEFALDLQTDRAGNFYYAKGSPWEPTVTSPHQGTMIKVSKDGSKFEMIATGLRAPNGLGMGPEDQLSASDNEGHWQPANKVSLIKPGGFYGMVTAAHKPLVFKTADGEFTANPSDPAAQVEHKTKFWGPDSPIPPGFDQPLVWLPKQVDNSPGGEVWVPNDAKWGPLGGRMLHMSYGKCTIFNVLQEEVDGVAQGGVHRFPIKFTSGIMRGRFSPKDGQLYLSGLNVWQSDASKFGCLYRLRYTGKPATLPVGLHATKAGMEIEFTGPLDEQSATDAENFSAERWNYIWSPQYGSADYSIAEKGKKGRDLVLVEGLKLSPDKKKLTLLLPDMSPAMQMKIKYKIQSADGRTLEQEIYNTINRLPGEG